MNDWQHQQQLDEQERRETIERLLQTATGAIYEVFGQDYAELWRKDVDAEIVKLENRE